MKITSVLFTLFALLQLSCSNKKIDLKGIETDFLNKAKRFHTLYYNQSRVSDIVIDSALLDNFTGRFAEFEITKQSGKSYFRDVNQKNKTPFPMIPVS